ncbi:amino acid permease [Stakelama tenebrarum]|uniref:Arginine/agmatine antiporter n=1 Tax=Stakelama tenebrarum TaxID=2711215 RepID=A0A6G6Y5D7_9SPHN|nr:amino acid permease [Sphingosinithalassobacter tenebrarum]QIG80164.1 amino acid permease [Sphingosinithalassobacter tenebrarum]
MCLALVVGNMIGAGVFMLPASLAPYGWNAVFGWIVTIGGGLCLAFTFARLAQALPQAGGPYAYTRAAFGQTAGFVVAWAYWISLWVGNAAIATAGIGYLAVFFPVLDTVPGLPAISACAVIWLFTWINCRGVRAAGGVQMVTTVLKLLPLIAVVAIAGWMVVDTGGEALMPFDGETIGFGAIGATAAITLWALLGLESATIVAHDVEDPQRTIPRATLWGTAITGLVYLLVCSGVTLLMPVDQAANSNAPLADFVAASLGSGSGMVVALFAAISAFGALNGWILLQGEMPNAMARDGVFPAFFATRSRRDTPVRAHIVSTALLTVIVLLNYTRSLADLFTFIALLATTASLVAYLACSCAALALAWRKRMIFTAPAALVAMIAALYSAWTIYGAGAEAAGWGLVLLLAGIPVHLLMRRKARTVSGQTTETTAWQSG